MKEYKIRVTEVHTDHVWIKANSRSEALLKAPAYAQCEYEFLDDCEIMEEHEVEE